MGRRRPSARSRARSGEHAGAARAALLDRLAALQALRDGMRGANRAGGRAAIDAQSARFVAKRIPPGALPDKAWAMLVEGGTDLRRGDLLWAATALAVHLEVNPGDLAHASEAWRTVADYLRRTRNKPHGPWPMVVEEAVLWHHRAAIVAKRREAQAALRGTKPPRKPFLTFGDGNFAVMLKKASELDVEGKACGHCLAAGRAKGELHFSLRAPDNLPFFTGTFILLLHDPREAGEAEPTKQRARRLGIVFVETKGNFNRIPLEHVAQARGVWRALVKKHGPVRDIKSVDDWLALWFPRPFEGPERQRDHRLSAAVGEIPRSQITAAAQDMVPYLTDPGYVGRVFATGLKLMPLPEGVDPRKPRKMAIDRLWPALRAVSEAAAIGFAGGLEDGDFALLVRRKDVPPLLKLTAEARRLAGKKLGGEKERPPLSVPRRLGKEVRKVSALARLAGTSAMGILASGPSQDTFALWLLFAPHRAAAEFFAALVQGSPLALSYGYAAAKGLLRDVYVLRASRLPRDVLRVLAEREPAAAAALAAARPDAALSAGPTRTGLLAITRGQVDLSETPEHFQQRVLALPARTYTVLVAKVAGPGLYLGHRQTDRNAGEDLEVLPEDAAAGLSDEDAVEAEQARAGHLLASLFWLLNSAPEKVESGVFAPTLLEAIWVDAAMWEQGDVWPPELAVDRLASALADETRAGRLEAIDSSGLVYLGPAHEVLAQVITTLVEGDDKADALDAVSSLMGWADDGMYDFFTSITENPDARGSDVPPLLWALDYTDAVSKERADQAARAKGGEPPPFHGYLTELEGQQPSDVEPDEEEGGSPLPLEALQAMEAFADAHGLPYGLFLGRERGPRP